MTEDTGGLDSTLKRMEDKSMTLTSSTTELKFVLKVIGLDRRSVFDILLATILLAVTILSLNSVFNKKKNLIQAENDLLQYENWKAEGENIQSDLQVLSKNLAAYDEQLSAQDELGLLLTMVSKMGKKWSLELLQTESLDNKIKSEQYSEIKIRLSLRGKYGNILGFIAEMENQDSPYFFTDSQLKTDKQDDEMASFSTTLITIALQG
mgnify:CR=1 FL=1